MDITLDMDQILEYEPLVYGVMNRFSWYPEREDLYQAGMIGLMNALKKFKNNGQAKFSSYAYTSVLGEITTFIRENKNVKVSRDLLRMNKQIEKAKDILRQKLLREPSDYEISIYLGIKEEELAYIKEVCMETKSLDEAREENNEMNYYNAIKTYDQNMDSTIIDLHRELHNLSLEEQQIIYSKYYQGYSQSEISEKLSMSQSQISRKENKILEKLKYRL